MTNSALNSAAEEIKDLLADPKDRIRLDDFVTALLKSALQRLSADSFWQSPPAVTAETIQARLTYYDQASNELLDAAILLGRWGNTDQRHLLEKMLFHLAELNKPYGGLLVWGCLRWYPVSMLAHAAGAAALSVQNYTILTSLFLPEIRSDVGGAQFLPISVRAENEILEIIDCFKMIPGFADRRFAYSDFLFEKLRKPIDEALFLGSIYEKCFDEFEVLRALSYAHLTQASRGRIWARPGRFAWKREAPFLKVVAAAQRDGQNWLPLRAGLFESSIDVFNDVAKGYGSVLAQIQLY